MRFLPSVLCLRTTFPPKPPARLCSGDSHTRVNCSWRSPVAELPSSALPGAPSTHPPSLPPPRELALTLPGGALAPPPAPPLALGRARAWGPRRILSSPAHPVASRVLRRPDSSLAPRARCSPGTGRRGSSVPGGSARARGRGSRAPSLPLPPSPPRLYNLAGKEAAPAESEGGELGGGRRELWRQPIGKSPRLAGAARPRVPPLPPSVLHRGPRRRGAARGALARPGPGRRCRARAGCGAWCP